MYEFIVLGLIPGTHIRISFGVWLALASALFAVAVWRKIQRSHFMHAVLIALVLLRATRRHQKLSQIS